MSDLLQMKLSLPRELAEYVHQQAARSDRTPSGMIRHWISEQRRREPSPDGTPVFPAGRIIPGVPATVDGIAAAKEHVVALLEEQKQLHRRKRVSGTTVAEDTRADAITSEVGIINQRIAAAEKMLPRNGG